MDSMGKGAAFSYPPPQYQIRVRSRPTLGPYGPGACRVRNRLSRPSIQGAICKLHFLRPRAPGDIRFQSTLSSHDTSDYPAKRSMRLLTRPFPPAQPCPRPDATWRVVLTLLFYLACLFPSLPTWQGGPSARGDRRLEAP